MERDTNRTLTEDERSELIDFLTEGIDKYQADILGLKIKMRSIKYKLFTPKEQKIIDNQELKRLEDILKSLNNQLLTRYKYYFEQDKIYQKPSEEIWIQ